MRGCGSYSLSFLGSVLLAFLLFGYQGVIVVLDGYFLFGALSRRMNPVNMVNERGTREDFMDSLLKLTSVIMKADGKVMRSELQYVQQFIGRSFGESYVQETSLRLREYLEQDVSIEEVALNIRIRMTPAMRLQLLHFLVAVAKADAAVSARELEVLRRIAAALGISRESSESVFAMFDGQTIEDAYHILEIEPGATDEEVRKAYKKMSLKHHPDKVAYLGPDIQAAATEKFKSINQAYEKIKAARGF